MNPLPTEHGTPALAANDLAKTFALRGGLLRRMPGRAVQAVSGVSFAVERGRTLGVLGESGCGKSTLARMLVGLTPPDAGTLQVEGRKVLASDTGSLELLRRHVQMVFQDSFASLNPRLAIGESIAFGPRVRGAPRRAAMDTAMRLLARTGMDPRQFAHRFPHELSGGQRQRVNIARALAGSPSVVVLDEAVSALDKHIEAQVLELLQDLQRELQLAYVFISHDLDVVRHVSHRVMVMYLGKIVESGPSEALFRRPRHPYTRALMASKLSADPGRRIRVVPLAGEPPSPIDPPSGCRFRTRCPHAAPVCAGSEPVLAVIDGAAHRVACHRSEAMEAAP